MNTFSALSQLDRKDKAIKPTSKPRKQDKATITPSKGKKAKIGANIRNKSESPPLPSKKAIKQAIKTPPQAQQSDRVKNRGEVKKLTSKEVKKDVWRLSNKPNDQPINKVGYYFTRKEIDQLDNLVTRLKPILRDRFGVRVTKNEIIRASLKIGLKDWEENQLTSKLMRLLVKK